MDVNSKVRLYAEFTDTYRRWADDPARRELECMRVQYPLWLEPVAAGDLCAGRGEFSQEIGFTPQALINKFGYYIDLDKSRLLLGDPRLTPENRTIFAGLIAYWREEETVRRLRASYTRQVAELLPSDDWQHEAGEAFPLYRMSGTQLDFDKLLCLGIPGLRAEAEARALQNADTSCEKFYRDMIRELDFVVEVMRWYADELCGRDSEKERKIAQILESLCVRAPETMREAIQLSYLYCQLSGSLNFGRMDEYLGDFLAEDLRAGRLTEEEAIRMLGAYWRQIERRMRVYDSRLTLGGRGRRNPGSADRFALCAIEATRREKCLAPQVSLRFYEGQNPELMARALDALGEGCTFPMLYNDDVNISAVMRAFGVSYDEAVHYIPFGCGEYTLYHRSVGTPSGVINLMQVLLETLRLRTYPDYDSLWTEFTRRVRELATALACQELQEYRFAAQTAPFLLISALYDDCMERGLPVFGGGVRYLGGTLESYGGTNAADSLVAIRELVYEQKELTQRELVRTLESDFADAALWQARCRAFPKFGNDDDRADRAKTDVDRMVCQAAIDAGVRTGLDSYLVVFINNDANTILGRYTGASPDGRHAGAPLANGNAPSGGCDRSGVTALLNSMVKPATDIHAGAVQNVKFSKEMFTRFRSRTEALLDAYFAAGGAQLMITVVGHGELEAALAEPAEYRNLIVRVGGFSARFVELGPDVQREILSRTLY